MDKKRYLSILGVAIGVLLVYIAGGINGQEIKDDNEVLQIEQVTQNEEKNIEPFTVHDAIDVTFVPQETGHEQEIATEVQICESKIKMVLPKRFWNQSTFSRQYAHVTEYHALDDSVLARERIGFKNDTCHFNLYVVCNISDENIDLLSKQTEQEVEGELLLQPGLTIIPDEFHTWNTDETKQIMGVAYKDEEVSFIKYYFRYVDFQNHNMAFFSIGLSDPTEEEISCMKNSISQIDIQVETFADMEQEAQNGNIVALYYCGRCYTYGYGVEKNNDLGFLYLHQAAEAGNASSQNYVGYAYLNGEGVETSTEDAVAWFTKAAEAGNGEAMNNLGNRYYDGNGVEKDYETAVVWYKKAIEAGNTTAYYNLANRYRYGDGVKQDKEKAIEYYELAAKAGIVQANTRLANMYYDGEGVSQDKEKALQYLKIAAAAGDQSAIDKLSKMQ